MAGLVEGRVALITGGSSGIGRGTALVFAREGAKVAIADIQVEQGQETVRLVKEAGGEAVFVKCDVSVASEVKAAVEKVVETFGRLDCGFNNAGIESTMAKTADCTEEDWDRVMAVNLKGVWLCMKCEIPEMLKQGGGAIVNTASINGVAGVRWHEQLLRFQGRRHTADTDGGTGVCQVGHPHQRSLPRRRQYPDGQAAAEAAYDYV